jgi:hypothetical protein
MIHLACQVCGDQTDWRCHSGKATQAWRVELYVNQHLHGLGRPVVLRRPG